MNQPALEHQVRISARNCGMIDPSNIDHYIARGGYRGLARALTMTPEEVIREVAGSRLKGRGGEGFSTAEEWRSCRAADGSGKLMICNALEMDPEALSAGMLLDGDPHAVLEGMVIGAYAIGAAFGAICVRPDQVSAIEALRKAVEQSEDRGFTGADILGYGFEFRVEIQRESEESVCEATAVMLGDACGPVSLIRPPSAAFLHIGGKCICAHSAETFASVSAILEKGAKWFSGFGTEGNGGTKLVTLTGKVAHPGVIEVALGTALRQIVEEIGGGITGSGKLKAMLIGGPSGGFLPPNGLDLPLDYERLSEEGACMGSGRVTVFDNDSCIVDLAKACLSLSKSQTCGRCVMCREGTSQLYLILKDITEGKGKSEDVELLSELGEGMRIGAACAFGKAASNPVFSLIRHFREELDAHIKRKRCPALVCRKYITYHVLGEKCRGCRMCSEKCPENAIAGGDGMIHVIDQDDCTRCGTCADVCPPEYAAVAKAGPVKPKTPSEPVPVGTWRKR